MSGKSLKIRKGFILKVFVLMLLIFLLFKLLFIYFECTQEDKWKKKFFSDYKISRLSYYVRESNGKPVIYLQAKTRHLDKIEAIFTTNKWKNQKKIAFQAAKADPDNQIWRVNLGRFEANEKVEFYINEYKKNNVIEHLNNEGLNYQIGFKKHKDGLEVIENFPKNDVFSNFSDGFKRGSYNEATESGRINAIKKSLEEILVRQDVEAIENFKKNHPVVVSLTTSPKRISKIKHVIDTLDLTFVDEVIVVVPNLYGRTQSPYVIPRGLEGYQGKTKILRIEKDLGPITKLLPAVEYVRSKPNGQNGIVITIDDDIGYSKGLIRELILGVILKGKSVMSGFAQNLGAWNIHGFGFPSLSKKEYAKMSDKTIYVEKEIVEGFSGIAYRVGDVDTKLMRFLSQGEDFKECFVSDDLVISFVLAYSGIHRYAVQNKYIRFKPFSYGLDEDALYHGAGFLSTPVSSDINTPKYQQCYKKLIETTMDFEVLKLKDRKSILQSSR